MKSVLRQITVDNTNPTLIIPHSTCTQTVQISCMMLQMTFETGLEFDHQIALSLLRNYCSDSRGGRKGLVLRLRGTSVSPWAQQWINLFWGGRTVLSRTDAFLSDLLSILDLLDLPGLFDRLFLISDSFDSRLEELSWSSCNSWLGDVIMRSISHSCTSSRCVVCLVCTSCTSSLKPKLTRCFPRVVNFATLTSKECLLYWFRTTLSLIVKHRKPRHT